MVHLLYFLMSSLTWYHHLIFPQERSFVFRHLFCRYIVKLLDPFGNFIGDRFITGKIQAGNIEKNPVQPVDAGFLSVNGNFFDFYLVRRDTSADRAIVSILLITAHSLLPYHSQCHLEFRDGAEGVGDVGGKDNGLSLLHLECLAGNPHFTFPINDSNHCVVRGRMLRQSFILIE